MYGVKYNNRTGREMKQFLEGTRVWAPSPCGHSHSLFCGGIQQTSSMIADYVSHWEIISAKGPLGLEFDI